MNEILCRASIRLAMFQPEPDPPQPVKLRAQRDLLNNEGIDEGVVWSLSNFSVRVDAIGKIGLADLSMTVERPAVSPGRTANQLLGVVGALTEDQERFLDLIGNRNGRLDVGDYLLFLRDQGNIAAALRTTHSR